MWPRTLLWLSVYLFTLVLPGMAQIRSVSHAWGPIYSPLSRGAMGIIRGENLAGMVEVAIPVLGAIGTEVGGVTVTIEGKPCLIYSVKPTEIRFVVAEDVPEPTPRKTWFGWHIPPQVLRVRGYQPHDYKLHLMDTAPWWNLYDGYPQGVILTMGAGLLVTPIERGVALVSENSQARLSCSGCRSFRDAPNVFYNVIFYTDKGEWLEAPAEVFADTMVKGQELVVFYVPGEWRGKKGFLYLQTPSNFSEGAPIEFKNAP